MESFVKRIKEKVDKLSQSYTQQDEKGIEDTIAALEKEEQEIADNLRRIADLLDLIEKHEVKAEPAPSVLEEIKHHNNWLEEIRDRFEKIHLAKAGELSPEERKFLENEKRKLEAVRKRLKRDQTHLHLLIAQSNVYLMETRDAVCQAATKGQSIDEVAEKLLEHFGKEFDQETPYEEGRRKAVKFIEETYGVSKMNAQKVFDVLEKSHILEFVIDPASYSEFMTYDTNVDYTEYQFSPIYGTWHIHA